MEHSGKYLIPAREIPVLGEYDILVVGGGAAGCAAAVTAGRCGMKVLLAEKYGFLGGATVSQLVGHILSTNGVDFTGIWHDWIRAVRKRGGVVSHGMRITPSQYRSGVDPEAVKFAWDDLMHENNVDLLLHTLCSEAIIENGVIIGVIVETVGGTGVILAKRVIDATGDGAVCAAAGVEWEQGDGKNLYNQALTKVFRMGNVDRSHVYTTEYQNEVKQLLDRPDITEQYSSEVVLNGRAIRYSAHTAVPYSIPEYRTEMNVFASRVLRVNTLDPWDLTRAEREGREQAWQCCDFIKKHIKGFEKAYLLDTNIHIGIRDSRRIRGIDRVTRNDALILRKRADSIAKSSWDIDIWPGDSYSAAAVSYTGDEMKNYPERIKKGDYFDIPYGSIITAGVDNLLVAGRCVSADREAQASLRIQQTCQATGEAAGYAAAVSIADGITPRELDGIRISEELWKMRAKVEPAFTELSASL